MKFLEIRAQRRLEESRHRRFIELQDRKRKRREELEQAEHERKNKYHSVRVVETKTPINLMGRDQEKVGECTPIWVLQENGYGDRRYQKEFRGHNPKHGWENVWEHCNLHGEVIKWVHRDPDCKVPETPLPPNAEAEDRAWHALGATL